MVKLGTVKPVKVSLGTNKGGSVQQSSTKQNQQITGNSNAGHIVQNAASTTTLNNATNVRLAALRAQELARVAAEQRAREAAAEAARIKAAVRAQVQARLDTNVLSNKTELKTKAMSVPKVSLGRVKPVKILAPKSNLSEDEQAENQAYSRALKEYQERTRFKGSGFWATAFDKATFGQTRRQMSARNYFGEKSAEVQDRGIFEYETLYQRYEKNYASAQARINKARETKSAAEVERMVKAENDKLLRDYNRLKELGIKVSGQIRGYTAASQSATTGLIGKAFSGTVGALQAAGGAIARGTIGEGWENVPSAITLFDRVANYLGNLNTNDRTIYRHDGTSMNRLESGKNAWQATFGQRSGNHRPWVDLPFNKKDAEARFGSQVDSILKQRGSEFGLGGKKLQNPSDVYHGMSREQILRKLWDGWNQNNRIQNSLAMTMKDPLSGAGLGANKLVSLAGRAAAGTTAFKTVSAAKPVTAARSALNTLKQSRPMQWLTAEHKTHAQRVNDEIFRELDDVAQKQPKMKALINEWAQNGNTIKARAKFEEFKKVTDDLAALSKDEINALQYLMRPDKRLSASVDKLTRPQLEKVTKLAEKHRSALNLSQKLEIKEGVATPFRKNYIPQYGRGFKPAQKVRQKLKAGRPDWWFTKRQTKQRTQTKKQLTDSLAARQYGSRAARHDLPVLRTIHAGRKDIKENFSRIRDAKKTVKKSAWERVTDVTSLPTKVWKKSVLATNPAWYLNNELFNQIQGITAGGTKFIKNQRGTQRYLQHLKRNAGRSLKPSELREFTEAIGTDVEKLFGKLADDATRVQKIDNATFGRLSKVASSQESRARIALYRTYRQHGLDHKAAVKRVDKYLFRYGTKNWERPIKALVPFWAWQKGLAKAGARMPFQNPKAALMYTELQRYQDFSLDQHFNEIVPKLKELGYTDAEIEAFRAEHEKYNKGKIRVGDRYINTPFNAFSTKGMDAMGVNPYVAATNESLNATDFFGNKIDPQNSVFWRRIISKFPQLELGLQGFRTARLDVTKPTERWIGEPGSSGLGMTKEKQGYDKSKKNYVKSLDPSNNLTKNILAFVGIPRSNVVSMSELFESKRLQKLTDEYFGTDWDSMKYDEAQAKRKKLFERYGVTEQQFFDSKINKYDTPAAQRTKALKADAAALNKMLFEEYSKQKYGTRSKWAVEKLKELNSIGYFEKNPYLKSFDWLTGDTVARVNMQKAYELAKKTGDWSQFNIKYGDRRSAKKIAYDIAKKTGDWTAYRAKYGVKKQSPHQYQGKFFKTAESRQKYIDGEFWRSYAAASKAERKKLMADNPQYNTRKDWTQAQWDAANLEKKTSERQRLMSSSPFAAAYLRKKKSNQVSADTFIRSRKGNQKKIRYSLAK